jgi:hypothetical protein
MKFLSLSAIIFLVFLKIPGLYAMGLDEISLQEVSTSKKTIIIDRGILENYTEKSWAKFFIQSGDFRSPKIFLVGEGKLVKSFPKKSIWYLSKIIDPRFFLVNGHLLVLTSNQVKAGRSIKIKQRHVVIPPDRYESIDQYLEENKNNIPNRLLQDSSTHDESVELFETPKIAGADVEIDTYEALKKRGGIQFSDQYNDEIKEKYFIGNHEVKLGNIENEEDKKLLDSIAMGFVEKINSQRVGLKNGLYKNQEKVPGLRDINNKMSITSVYDSIKEDQLIKEQVSPKAFAKIKRDGPLWSADMDDASLRRYFISTGIEHELKRRELSINELDGNEVMFHFSGSLTDHTSNADQNYRSQGFSLGLGYDYHLSRSSKDLKNWSIQFVFESGVSDYDIGGLNARGQEGFYGGYLNYYFFNNPLTLNSFIFLGGLGLKGGSVEMDSVDLSKKYSYQALVFPALQVLTKYRFRSGDLADDVLNVGASFNAGINLDIKRLGVIDSLDDDINGKISITDIKYLLGMSVYF